MKKVTIEITENGWKTTIQLGEKSIVDENRLTATGAEGLTESLEYNEEICDELCDALCGFHCYDIAVALRSQS